jgi:hypothetical protein
LCKRSIRKKWDSTFADDSERKMKSAAGAIVVEHRFVHEHSHTQNLDYLRPINSKAYSCHSTYYEWGLKSLWTYYLLKSWKYLKNPGGRVVQVWSCWGRGLTARGIALVTRFCDRGVDSLSMMFVWSRGRISLGAHVLRHSHLVILVTVGSILALSIALMFVFLSLHSSRWSWDPSGRGGSNLARGLSLDVLLVFVFRWSVSILVFADSCGLHIALFMWPCCLTQQVWSRLQFLTLIILITPGRSSSGSRLNYLNPPQSHTWDRTV